LHSEHDYNIKEGRGKRFSDVFKVKTLNLYNWQEKLQILLIEICRKQRRFWSSPNYCVNSPLIDNMDLRLDVW
jgi:hypothetical protein